MSVENLNPWLTEERSRSIASLLEEGAISAEQAEELRTRVPSVAALAHGRELIERLRGQRNFRLEAAMASAGAASAEAGNSPS